MKLAGGRDFKLHEIDGQPRVRRYREMRWLIVADDLTGAADCAIAFARRGFESVVTWGEGARIAPPALSVDADSRGHSPAEAVRRQLATQGVPLQ
jgi:Sugar-binding N-terminal domain